MSNVYRLPMAIAPTASTRYRADLEAVAVLLGLDISAQDIRMLADRLAREEPFSPGSSGNGTG